MHKAVLISCTVMEQEKLEQRVKEIFEQQGFDVEQDGNEIVANRDDERKTIRVFSSEEYSESDIEGIDADIVFVDEDLEDISEKVDPEVSAIREDDDDPDYDLPSYELIGDIAVINDLAGREEDVAVEGIREHHPQVKTVLLKDEPLSGEFRVGGYERLYGDDTETTHKEFGCRYRVDPTKAYFSERLGTERKRVVDQVEDGEKILVIGAGVGPYPVLAARKAEPEKVVAVEKNPDAVSYMEKNIELNKVSDTVEAVEGGIEEVELEDSFDRVIIAVPEFADEFLDTAFDHAKEGSVIHYYRFLEDENWDSLTEEVEETGHDYEVVDKIVCGQRGPSVDRVCIDLEI